MLYGKTSNLEIFKILIIDLFLCLFINYVLQGIDIDERVLMMWKKHSDGVPNVLIDNTNILSEGVGTAALRIRRLFMRTGYVPRDVPEFATK